MKILSQFSKYNFVLVLGIALSLFLIPQIFWGNLYYVGGDATRMYYVFPFDFFHFTFRLSSDNSLGVLAGYYPKSFYAPLFFAISLLKQIVPNVQFFFFGLNMSLGFLFFYLFLGLWYKQGNLFRIISSLFYILSPYFLSDVYKSELFGTYLISVVPIALYLFFKSIQEQKFILLIFDALFLSLFSLSFNTFPWAYGLCITLLPLFIYMFLEYKKTFVVYGFILIVLFFFLNIHWLGHLLYPILNPSGMPSALEYYSSNDFKQASEMAIKNVSGIYGPLNRVFNEMDLQLIKNFSVLTLVKMFFILVVLSGGLFLRNIPLKLKKSYLLSISCLILAFYFFQPKAGNWGDDIFIFLTNHVPLFSAFRNMFSKFTFSMAFTYAFAFYFSLVILSKKIKRKYLYIIAFVSFFLIFIYSNNFLFKRFNETNFSYRISGQLNDDFNNLLAYIKTKDSSGKILWLPLNYPSYITIEDKYLKNHYYVGPSILPVLTPFSDYTGYLNFATTSDQGYSYQVFSSIAKKQYDEVGKLFRLLNIKYVVINNQADTLPSDIQSFLYYIRGMREIQNDEFKKEILGKKLKDFGGRYSLYEINDNYNGKKIYTAASLNSYPPNESPVYYEKLSDLEFNVVIPNLKGSTNLVLQDLYSKNWLIDIYSGSTIKPYKYKLGNSVFNNFANYWNINDSEIRKSFPKEYYKENSDGSISVKLKLIYESLNFTPIFNKISIISYILTGIFIIFYSIFVLIKDSRKRLC